MIDLIASGVGSIMAATIAAVGTYWVAKRQFSGQVATTDADGLWKEAGELRRDYQGSITRLSKEVERLQKEITSRDAIIAELQQAMAQQEARHAQEMAQLKAQHTREIGELGAQYSRQISDLRTELSHKESDRLALMGRVEELEHRLEAKREGSRE